MYWVLTLYFLYFAYLYMCIWCVSVFLWSLIEKIWGITFYLYIYKKLDNHFNGITLSHEKISDILFQEYFRNLYNQVPTWFFSWSKIIIPYINYILILNFQMNRCKATSLQIKKGWIQMLRCAPHLPISSDLQ